MAASIEIDSQGDHQYVVRLRDGEDVCESWFNITPAVLDEVGVDGADVPSIVELEDVLATYDDYVDAMRG
jgi:hypothetical protein